jgi:hypothetical protein
VCLAPRKPRYSGPHGGVGTVEGPEILQIVAEMERDKVAVEGLGALNRWPTRSEDYLRLWRASCAEIRAPGLLPAKLAQSLCLG